MNVVAQHITAAAHRAGTRTLHAGGPIAFVLKHAMQPQKARLVAAAAAGLAAALAAHVYQRWRMRRRIRRMTKVELHAHLNGSIRPTTLRRLAAERGLDAISVAWGKGEFQVALNLLAYSLTFGFGLQSSLQSQSRADSEEADTVQAGGQC